MKRTTFVRSALVLSGILLSAQTWAQAPDNAPPPGAPGAPGGGFRGGQRNGGRGGFGGNFSFGTVSAVDASASTITVTPRGGGSDQIIQVSPSASLVTQTPTAVGALRVGEQVRVSGIPTTITASQIVVGAMPGALGGPGGGAPGGRFGGPGGTAPGGQFTRQGGPRFNGGRPGAGGGPGGSTMTITASVLSLNPLTLMAPDNTSITLKMASDAKISRLSTIALGGVKVGDQIIASGQTGTDGVFTATSVADNLDMGSMMGRGGMGGGGRFGGPGGRMRQRGGQDGGQAPAGGGSAAPEAGDGNGF